MTTTELVEFHPDTLPRQLDDIDFVAEKHALTVVEERAELIESEKAKELKAIFERLNLMFAGRRIGDSVHVGRKIHEQEVFATRTPDCASLDEIFTRQTVYNPANFKEPQRRYEVEMLEHDGSKRVVMLEADGTMHFWQGSEGAWTALDEAGANETMFDLVMRAETAVGTYELRKDAAVAQGLDPTTYTDLADGDAYEKMQRLGYVQVKETSLE